MKFVQIVPQVNKHRMTESDFGYEDEVSEIRAFY